MPLIFKPLGLEFVFGVVFFFYFVFVFVLVLFCCCWGFFEAGV